MKGAFHMRILCEYKGTEFEIDILKNVCIYNGQIYDIMWHPSKLNMQGDMVYIHFHDSANINYWLFGEGIEPYKELIVKNDQVEFNHWLCKLLNDNNKRFYDKDCEETDKDSELPSISFIGHTEANWRSDNSVEPYMFIDIHLELNSPLKRKRLLHNEIIEETASHLHIYRTFEEDGLVFLFEESEEFELVFEDIDVPKEVINTAIAYVLDHPEIIQKQFTRLI
jgi:hypothetical protein